MNMKFKTLHILGNWNMHLYTKFSFLSRIDCEKNWKRIRKQETWGFFPPLVPQSICHIYKKKTYHIKLKKNKIMKLKFWKTKREGSRRIDMYGLSRIVSQFAKSSSMDTAIILLLSCLEFRPLAIDVIECYSSFFCFFVKLSQ